MQPLNCSSLDKLSTFSLVRLRSLAIHRGRLDENWSRSLPVVCGEIKSIATRDDYEIICLVPGTDIIIMFSPNFRCLVCYDVATTRRFHNRVPLDTDIISDTSLPQESPGNFKMALLTNQLRISSLEIFQDNVEQVFRPTALRVIIIEHELGTITSFQATISVLLDATAPGSRVFLHDDITGVVVNEPGSGVFVRAFDLETGSERIVQTSFPHV